MRRIALILCLSAAPAFAQPSPPSVVPPPFPQGPVREPGIGERAGAALDRGMQSAAEAGARAARATSDAASVAGSRAAEWGGSALERFGEWTQRQGARLRGAPDPASMPAPEPMPPPAGMAPLPPPVAVSPLPPPQPR